jgi:hypothetical protein
MNRRASIKQRGKGVGDILSSIVNTYFTEQEFPGEHHGKLRTPDGRTVRANFMGPGTNIEARLARGDQGVNDVDNAAREHDIAYLNAGRSLKRSGDRNAFKQAIWSADDKFIAKARNSTDDPKMGNIAATMIGLKEKGEKIGILPTRVFSGGRDPAHRLREYANASANEQSGGFGPIASILIPIVASLGAEAISSLFHKITGKGMIGGAIHSLDTDQKRNAIISLIQDA